MAMNECGERGFHTIALDTFAMNGHARAVYARLGFADETLTMVNPNRIRTVTTVAMLTAVRSLASVLVEG